MIETITVRIQRRNRYSQRAGTEKETVRNIEVDIEDGTALMNGKIFKYVAISGNKFGKLSSKKSCYYITEVIG